MGRTRLEVALTTRVIKSKGQNPSLILVRKGAPKPHPRVSLLRKSQRPPESTTTIGVVDAGEKDTGRHLAMLKRIRMATDFDLLDE